MLNVVVYKVPTECFKQLNSHEKSVPIYQTTRPHTPQDRNISTYCHRNLTSRKRRQDYHVIGRRMTSHLHSPKGCYTLHSLPYSNRGILYGRNCTAALTHSHYISFPAFLNSPHIRTTVAAEQTDMKHNGSACKTVVISPILVSFYHIF